MSAAMGFFLLGTQERVRNSRGKRAISVRAIEVLLYLNLLIAYIQILSCLIWNYSPSHLGLVVQSIVSLTSLLRGQLVKCYTSL